MDDRKVNCARLVGSGAALVATADRSEAGVEVEMLIAEIQNPHEKVNGPACENAGAYGAAALRPLGALLQDPDFETRRRAKRAMYKIVRHSSVPGVSSEKKAVEAALIPLLMKPSAAMRRDILWMLSEVGSGQAVEVVSVLLSDQDVR